MGTSDTNVEQTHAKGCGCAGCQSGTPDSIIATQQEYEALHSGGGGHNAPGPAADPTTFANYLTHGFWTDMGSTNRSWDHNNLTYSLSNEFTAAQKDGLRMAFDLWEDVADITFTEVAGGADMTVLEGDDSAAYSSSSTSGTTILSNTISIDTNPPWWTNFDDIGDYALMTAIHEIGHSLGLGHTGNYNGSATYADDAQWANDSHQMTVMSYFNDQNVGSDHWDSSNAWQYSATPMLIDIVAIQNIYGANTTTRSGNTTYGFNSDAGMDQYDFSISQVPIAIWDGGGNDTLDLSGYSQDQTIYLTEGDFSSTGYMTNNLVIAYGTTIENAVGGTGADTIYGNDVDNVITGNAGDDIIFGTIGNDTIDGGANTDTVNYTYAVNEFAYNFIDGISLSISHLVLGFTDLLSNIENYIFAGVSYTRAFLEANYGDNTMNGTASNDRMSGTAAPDEIHAGDGSDTIRAGDGDDTVYGDDGNDIIWAGTGDNTVYGGNGNDYFYLSGSINTVDGGAGNDEIRYGHSNVAISVNLTAGTVDENRDGSIEDNLTSIEYVVGSRANDQIVGDANNNRLQGNDGDDLVQGGDGSDSVFGNNGNDTLYGQNGRDYLFGGEGNDLLYGGAGADVMRGQGGTDSYIWEAADMDGSVDTIYTFSIGNNDSLNISDLLVGYNALADAITDFIQITDDGTNSFLAVDSDGGANNFVQIATLMNVTGLTDEKTLETNGNLITV